MRHSVGTCPQYLAVPQYHNCSLLLCASTAHCSSVPPQLTAPQCLHCSLLLSASTAHCSSVPPLLTAPQCLHCSLLLGTSEEHGRQHAACTLCCCVFRSISCGVWGVRVQMEFNDLEGSWVNEKHELEKRIVELEARWAQARGCRKGGRGREGGRSRWR